MSRSSSSSSSSSLISYAKILGAFAAGIFVGSIPSILRRRRCRRSSSPPPSSDPSSRVLSIQSSVVYGYVGNKCSIFTLETLGFDADPIHSVQFSNHTAYPSFSGSKASGEELRTLTKGMWSNGFFEEYTHLLLGYLGTVDFLAEIVEMVKKMKSLSKGGKGKELFFLCDPVLGDNGKLYVPASFIPLYRQLVSYADFVTPNQTEAELLTEIKINSFVDAYIVCCWFHRRGVKTVVITSLKLPDSKQRDGKEFIELIATTTPSPLTSLPSSVLHMKVPQIGGYFVGTGDVTASLLLGWTSKLSGKSNNFLREAISKSIASVQAIIHRTFKNGSKELSLIQSKKDIECPPPLESFPDISLTESPAPTLSDDQLKQIDGVPNE